MFKAILESIVAEMESINRLKQGFLKGKDSKERDSLKGSKREVKKRIGTT